MLHTIPLIETLVGLSMIGVAAVIRWRHPQRHHRVRRDLRRPPPWFRVRWLPAPMGIAGALLIAYAWITDNMSPPSAAAIAAAVPRAAPVAGPGGALRHGVLLLRGTPADDDTATDEAARDYAGRLASLLADTMARPPVAIALESEVLDAELWKSLRADPAGARQWCRTDPPVEFVAVVNLPALRLPDGIGYAPWREPEELLVACHSEAQATQRGRVNERLGDRVPYEQALAEELRTALAKIGIRAR